MKLTTLLRQLVKQNITLRVDGEQLHVQAPAGVMTETLRAAITKQKSELMTWLQLHETDHTHQALPQVLPRPEERHQPFPLTDIQHAYWIGRNGSLTLGNVSTHSYTEYRCCDLDVERLTQALNQVIARHEMLRAIVLPTGQQQILSESEPYCIPVLDLSVATPVERAKELAAVREELSHQVLPLEQCPLFDIRVTRLCATDWLLHISIDLLMFDVSSLYTIYYEWHTLYTNPYAHLPMTELSFRDYILAEEELKATSLYRNARNYWLQRVDTLPLGPELPVVDTPVATVPQTFQRHSHELDTNAWEKLKTQAQQLGISRSVLFLTVFATVLKSWSKQPWFTLNLTIFNRLPLHPDVSQIVGDFTSVTLVDIDFRRPIPFVEQCKRVHHRLWEGLEHHHFSGIEVMRELAQRRNISLAGLMPVIFTSPIGVVDGSSDTFFHPFGGEMHYDISQTPQIWLDHHITEIDGGVLLTWDTVDGLFPAGMVDDMFGAYCTLVDRLLTDADAWHDPQLSPIPPHQLEQRETVNATAAPISTEMLHTLFLKQVEPRATEPAIITPSQTLAYQELYQRANQVGHWLREQGTRPNTLVAVVMEKGWEQVVAVLGIQLAGAAYLPIDPNLPTERQHYLLAQGEVAIALTQSHLDERLTWPKTIQRLAIDIIALDTTLPPLEIVQQPTDLAYVIYTSGSTGLPKGVVIDHRGAVNTVLDVNRRYGVGADDRVLALSALNFDLSVYDIFGLLAAGGAIVLPNPDQRIDPKHWVELIEQHHVTVWNTVPALMQMLVEYTELQGGRVAESQSRNGQSATFPSYKAAMLHTIMLSGDWIPVTLPSRIRALWPDVQIYGMGGATEASIWSIDYPIEEVDPAWPSIPYGKPMTNQSFHVLDAHFNSCPTWVPGDLYIGGTGLALGYWQDEERTNASFFVHPQTGERLYKTGDLGRFFPDGNIEFLGREDFQVKIRGHRIELGEIETTLLQHDEVKEAVVNAVGDPKGNRQLVAYVVRDHFGQINGQASVETNGQTNGHINGQHSAAATPEATAFPEVTGVTLHDPLERLTFKLEQPGLRSLNGAVRAAISLPQPALTDEFRAAWLARQSYRQFVDRPIAQEQFSHFLTCLMQMEIVGAPLPKYRYPSAGGLYPIQSYVYLKPGQVDGVAAGFYYYQPATHQLLQLGQDDALMDALFPAVNQEIYAQSAFVLFLVAEMDAIQPMYGEMAQSFALLEAGYMSQLLMTEAPKHDLGLCPVGTGDETALRAALALTPTHQLLHVLAGGRIDPAQQRVWLQSDQPPVPKNWQSLLQEHLAARLPDYMVPTHYVALDVLPLTANGKVDRKALPVPLLTESQDTFVAPETDLEAEISTVLQKMVAIEQISITRDFFDLGVNSVQMVQLANHLRKELHREIPIAALFQHTTIQGLATYLANSEEQIVIVQEQRTDARSRRKARAQARLAQRQRR